MAIMAIGTYWDLSRLLPTRSLPKSASPSALTFPAIHYIVKLRISRTLLYLRGKALTECAGTPENLGSESPQKGTVMAFGGAQGLEMAPWFGDPGSRRTSKRSNPCYQGFFQSRSSYRITYTHRSKAERGRSSVNARQQQLVP
jgi:hypothetical protein